MRISRLVTVFALAGGFSFFASIIGEEQFTTYDDFNRGTLDQFTCTPDNRCTNQKWVLYGPVNEVGTYSINGDALIPNWFSAPWA